MYSQLDGGKRNVGHHWLCYQDQLKTNLAALQTDSKDFQLNANDRNASKFVTSNKENEIKTEWKQQIKKKKLKH